MILIFSNLKAVYGVLNAIEGCQAFQDVLDCTNIGPWYRAVQKMVNSHAGSHPLSTYDIAQFP